jgi:hypothetical protein
MDSLCAYGIPLLDNITDAANSFFPVMLWPLVKQRLFQKG